MRFEPPLHRLVSKTTPCCQISNTKTKQTTQVCFWFIQESISQCARKKTLVFGLLLRNVYIRQGDRLHRVRNEGGWEDSLQPTLNPFSSFLYPNIHCDIVAFKQNRGFNTKPSKISPQADIWQVRTTYVLLALVELIFMICLHSFSCINCGPKYKFSLRFKQNRSSSFCVRLATIFRHMSLIELLKIT